MKRKILTRKEVDSLITLKGELTKKGEKYLSKKIDSMRATLRELENVLDIEVGYVDEALDDIEMEYLCDYEGM